VLVTGVTYRNPAHLAKIVATLDVLSGGRAVCGLGAAWFEREHTAYGWAFPSARERLDLLEDALRLLPLMWGKGSPSFDGRAISVPEAMSYPRPLQDKIPIVVGGSGEKRTLKLVAQYADGCNFFGGPENVANKLEVLKSHCAVVGRNPAEIEVTHLSSAIVAPSHKELRDKLDTRRRGQQRRAELAGRLGAGIVSEQVERYSALQRSGVETAIVALPGVDEAALAGFSEVISQIAGNN
jgi:alkanesulfonate monooxygenase SsuD/methylene tetrahydromethanopterin reductase-like flavin-dependent oxidoreductase (luciferase family)